jgi:hypothetical protein
MNASGTGKLKQNSLMRQNDVRKAYGKSIRGIRIFFYQIETFKPMISSHFNRYYNMS